jgi:hypothetical protein
MHIEVNLPSQWRCQRENSRALCEEMDPIQTPRIRALASDLIFVGREEERRARRAVRCLYFDGTFVPGLFERENIEASSITFLSCDPSDLPGKVWTIRLEKALPFDPENELLAGLTKRTIPLIALCRVEFPHEIG